MLITVFSRPFFPSVGGVEQTTLTLARVLRLMGCSVTVITRTHGTTSEDDQYDFTVMRKPSFLSQLLTVLRADALICKGGIQVLPGLLSVLLRKRLIVWHEYVGPYYQSKRAVGGAAIRLLKNVIATHALIHVGVSRACIESKKLPRRCRTRVIYNRPDFGEPDKQDYGTGKQFDVIYCGRFIQSKGVFVLLEALGTFERLRKDLRVCLVGSGPEEVSLRRAVAGWKHVGVTFAGTLRNAQLASMYANARVLVMPSLEPEAMGLVAAEALLLGVPVVAGNHPAVEEIVGDAGVTYDFARSDCLYKSLCSVIENPKKLSELSAAALTRGRIFEKSSLKDEVGELLHLIC